VPNGGKVVSKTVTITETTTALKQNVTSKNPSVPANNPNTKSVAEGITQEIVDRLVAKFVAE
jgi:hypothetical protein